MTSCLLRGAAAVFRTMILLPFCFNWIFSRETRLSNCSLPAIKMIPNSIVVLLLHGCSSICRRWKASVIFCTYDSTGDRDTHQTSIWSALLLKANDFYDPQ